MPRVKLRETEAQIARLGELRRHVKDAAHDRPGVYRMITETGEVAYVGKSKRIRTRLLSYFRAEYPGEKAARIVREAATIEWGYVPNEFAALLEEMRLIKSLRPRFNIALKRDARNYAFVRVTDGRAPRLTVVRGSGAGDRGGVYYGPFSGAERLRDALRELSDALGLRDCTMDRQMRFADQPELLVLPARTPGCIRFEIGTCLGPCVAAPLASVYSERVRQARAFLQGDNEAPIERLQGLMLAASEELQFERAAALRDKLQRLEALRDQFDRLRFAVESLTFAYRVPGHEGDDRVYLLRRGVVRAERQVPRTDDEHAELRAVAAAVASATEFRGSTVVPAHEVDELLIVSSWFMNRPGEVERTEALSAR
jgi:excinuclease UvrABC nuclease subunit